MDTTGSTHPPFCFQQPMLIPSRVNEEHVHFNKRTHLFSFLSLAVDTDNAAVGSQPVELPQHLHGLVSMLIRQVEELCQQAQVLQREGLYCKQRLPIGSRYKHILRIQISRNVTL